ncbi:MAG: sulfurtransferase TusA family protein [Candidatus Thorarchaeota archaeon]
MDYDEELDACGQICPAPAMRTMKQLGKMKPGTVLKVLIDYKPATESVPRSIAKTNHKFLGMEEDEDIDGWAVYFEVVK